MTISNPVTLNLHPERTNVTFLCSPNLGFMLGMGLPGYALKWFSSLLVFRLLKGFSAANGFGSFATML